ncbi:peptidylprolyl isomerase [Luteibaculum oceani]|uniref:Peptidylprolyl isomerase n=1 Tax=Luteibaculum oceani TaxID=1294296 RepID=A0A5C6VA80_9FLAO|nr:peptidylprolyl isomerase [Luteibaculum oceani]TXC81371.1 peptidylprolyl isomerase [Luteibaculum oceani]
MPKFIRTLGSFLALVLISFTATAQKEDTASYQILDEILAVIGGEIVVASEFKEQKIQYSEQFGSSADPCIVFEQLLTQKLFLHNAKVDSVEVTEAQVEADMDRRMRYFIQQIGSKKALEEYYGKSIVQLKEDFRTMIREQLLIQGLQAQVSQEVKITPAEVEDFYNNIPKDSLPLVNSQVELAQIVVYPKISREQKQAARQKLEGIRKEILSGKDFATQAVLYSDDPGSAAKGGDLGMVEKGTFVPEFDAVGLSLQDGELSKVFESEYGYHLMQMLERRGEKYRARHILIKPKVTGEDKEAAKQLLDSLYNLVVSGEQEFGAIASEFSDDENTKNSGGIVINPATGNPRIDMSQLSQIDNQMFFVIDEMKAGDISKPKKFVSPGGKDGYRIVKLVSQTEPHRANLHDDYQVLQEAASAELKAQALENYIDRKLKTTYVRVNDEFKSCKFNYNWFKAN